MKKLALTLALLLILTCTSAIAEPDTSEDPYGAMSTEERNDLIKTLLSYNMRESLATYDTTREFKDQSRSNPIFVGQGVAFARAIGDETFELLLYLNDVIRGEEALDLVMEANPFNSEPDAGKEYVIGIFQMYLLDAESENSKIEVGQWDFEAVDRTGKVMNFESVAGTIRDSESMLALYEGGNGMFFLPIITSTDDVPYIVMRDSIWFDLTK